MNLYSSEKEIHRTEGSNIELFRLSLKKKKSSLRMTNYDSLRFRAIHNLIQIVWKFAVN